MARGWVWGYEGYEPKEERLREALCTLGNGYFATRGPHPRHPRARRTTRVRMWRAATTG